MPELNVRALGIPGVLLVIPHRLADARGYFTETWNSRAFAEAGIEAAFVQDNQSMSVLPGTIRGLHFQTPPHAQAKLVRVVAGAVFDVAVDLRRHSPSYGRYCAATLTAEGGEQLFVPRGFAHGFCTLEPGTIVAYKVDGWYSPGCDRGFAWNDPDLAIDWPVEPANVTTSAKDARLGRFKALESPF